MTLALVALLGPALASDCASEAQEAACEPPEALVEEVPPASEDLTLSYGMQFTPEAPAHHLQARLHGPKDAYLGAEIRYLPLSDLRWTGRLGLGFDVLGASPWDLQLGLWIGGAGTIDRTVPAATLYAGPMAGTEVALGVEGRRLFARYRWLAGIGTGPLDELLTEQEATVGFKLLPAVHAYGQYFVLSPGEADNRSGFGVGARVRF